VNWAGVRASFHLLLPQLRQCERPLVVEDFQHVASVKQGENLGGVDVSGEWVDGLDGVGMDCANKQIESHTTNVKHKYVVPEQVLWGWIVRIKTHTTQMSIILLATRIFSELWMGCGGLGVVG
jgi:hypothetical protein